MEGEEDNAPRDSWVTTILALIMAFASTAGGVLWYGLPLKGALAIALVATVVLGILMAPINEQKILPEESIG